MSTLARIVAPHFVAGIVLDERARVAQAAPIIGYMHGWTARRVAAYVDRKGWVIARVPAEMPGAA